MTGSLQTTGLKSPQLKRAGKAANNKSARLYKIENENGLTATISTCGTQLVSLLAPGPGRKPVDVVSQTPFIRQNADKTSGPVIWNVVEADGMGIEMNCVSQYMEGDQQVILKMKAAFLLTHDNSLRITSQAVADNNTLIDPGNNIFFNLNGADSGNILNHQVSIKADGYLPLDLSLMPARKVEPVTGSPFDFRNSATIGSRIYDHHPQLGNGRGYNHYFILNRHAGRTPVAKIRGDKSDIIMEVFTDQPALRFYSGNILNGGVVKGTAGGDEGNAAFMMEPQHLTDLYARGQFPLLQLKPGRVYKSVCCYRFKW